MGSRARDQNNKSKILNEAKTSNSNLQNKIDYMDQKMICTTTQDSLCTSCRSHRWSPHQSPAPVWKQPCTEPTVWNRKQCTWNRPILKITDQIIRVTGLFTSCELEYNSLIRCDTVFDVSLLQGLQCLDDSEQLSHVVIPLETWFK